MIGKQRLLYKGCRFAFRRVKEARRRQQEANVRRKVDEKNRQRECTLVGMKNASVGDQSYPEGENLSQGA